MRGRFELSEKYTTDQFKECYEIFVSELYDKDGYANVCVLNTVFGNKGDDSHNCLGCNFSEYSDIIKRYLSKHETLDSVQYDFTVYILLLYLLVERMEVIIEILQIPSVYKDKHFKVFQRVRKWANFIKHPKSFVLTHHPLYDFDNSGSGYEKDKSLIIINDNFVDCYYKGQVSIEDKKKNNIELLSKLKNRNNILVLFPNIPTLTKNVCYASNKFITLISENPIYAEILKDDTTISNYFENEVAQ